MSVLGGECAGILLYCYIVVEKAWIDIDTVRENCSMLSEGFVAACTGEIGTCRGFCRSDLHTRVFRCCGGFRDLQIIPLRTSLMSPASKRLG